MLHTPSATTGRFFSIWWDYPTTRTIQPYRTRSPGRSRCIEGQQYAPGTHVLRFASPWQLGLLPFSDLQQTCDDLALAKPKAHMRQFAEVKPLEFKSLSQGLCLAITKSCIGKGHRVLSRVVELAFQRLREILDDGPELQC